LRSLGGSLVGPIALETLPRFSVDIAFIGATGATEEGITVADVTEAQIKQTVIDRARHVIVPWTAASSESSTSSASAALTA
jgi:DeoR/GlpR family transcriptional regulator of sugar metabolism